MRSSSARIWLWMRVSSGDSSLLALALLLPLGRPTLRLRAGLAVLLAALALAAACSSVLRTTSSTAIGNERRSLVLIRLRVKNASPGMLLPYREAKKRSRPGG